MTPLPPDPPTVWQQCFFLHFFFSWVLVSGFLDLLSFSRGNRFSVLLVVCGIAGFSYFDSVCVSFVNSSFVFFLGFCDTTLLIPQWILMGVLGDPSRGPQAVIGWLFLAGLGLAFELFKTPLMQMLFVFQQMSEMIVSCGKLSFFS